MQELLRVEDLTTHIFTPAGVVRAVEGVSLRIRPSEAVALVGESGCGKSMTALSLMRLVRPPVRILGGRVWFKGRDLLALSEAEMRMVRGGEIAMVFQDPMTFLNPVFRVGDQVAEAICIHQGLGRRAAEAGALEALRHVKIPAPEAVVHYYPHQLSGGMRQRVLIAMAVACRPALLIADEPTTALDVTIQAQIMALLSDIRRELGSALLLISHDLGLVAEYCDRVYVMYAGEIVEEADVFGLFKGPQHPYTAALLKSSLNIDHRVAAFEAIEGQPPNLIAPPPGCRFHPRCPRAFEPCSRSAPPVVTLEGGRVARCWLHEDGR
ncbi:MAG: ABC transporter ATP-binding protein [Proteobacteria bacterium]|nr:ABC transporter ATP-binding protein [Pseudomonadota bacterium]